MNNPASPLNPSSVLSPANPNGLFSGTGTPGIAIAVGHQPEITATDVAVLGTLFLVFMVLPLALLVVDMRKHR